VHLRSDSVSSATLSICCNAGILWTVVWSHIIAKFTVPWDMMLVFWLIVTQTSDESTPFTVSIRFLQTTGCTVPEDYNFNIQRHENIATSRCVSSCHCLLQAISNASSCCVQVNFKFLTTSVNIKWSRGTPNWTRAAMWPHTTPQFSLPLSPDTVLSVGPVSISIMDPSFEAAAFISCLFMRIFSIPFRSFSAPFSDTVWPERRKWAVEMTFRFRCQSGGDTDGWHSGRGVTQIRLSWPVDTTRHLQNNIYAGTHQNWYLSLKFLECGIA